MEPFKNIYNKNSIEHIAQQIKKYDKNFADKKFLIQSLSNINDLEMKARVLQITHALKANLSKTYIQNLNTLSKTMATMKKDIPQDDGLKGFILWIYSTYVEIYGLDYPDKSLLFMEKLTQRFTAEFCIRQFLIHHPKISYSYLEKWTTHKSEHVRRLASEGTRPNLPWGIKVPHTHTTPQTYNKLIMALKDDSSLYVRKSVANHLNDISHIDENLFISLLKNLDDKIEHQHWIKKHASRTMLKKGHLEILSMFGFQKNPKIHVESDIDKKQINEGDSLELFVKIKSKKKQSLRIDYIINYMKSNGELSPKVFRLKDLEIEDEITFSKKISFKKVTTRKHYNGKHSIELLINGKKFNYLEFILKV